MARSSSLSRKINLWVWHYTGRTTSSSAGSSSASLAVVGEAELRDGDYLVFVHENTGGDTCPVRVDSPV